MAVRCAAHVFLLSLIRSSLATEKENYFRFFVINTLAANSAISIVIPFRDSAPPFLLLLLPLLLLHCTSRLTNFARETYSPIEFHWNGSLWCGSIGPWRRFHILWRWTLNSLAPTHSHTYRNEWNFKWIYSGSSHAHRYCFIVIVASSFISAATRTRCVRGIFIHRFRMRRRRCSLCIRWIAHLLPCGIGWRCISQCVDEPIAPGVWVSCSCV